MTTEFQRGMYWFLMWGVVSLLVACSQTVTVYWAKPGAGAQELEQDKEECRSLQRAVGNNEDRIDQCLVVKGWSEVRTESTTDSSPSP